MERHPIMFSADTTTQKERVPHGSSILELNHYRAFSRIMHPPIQQISSDARQIFPFWILSSSKVSPRYTSIKNAQKVQLTMLTTLTKAILRQLFGWEKEMWWFVKNKWSTVCVCGLPVLDVRRYNNDALLRFLMTLKKYYSSCTFRPTQNDTIL